jgi:hypothetical protein
MSGQESPTVYAKCTLRSYMLSLVSPKSLLCKGTPLSVRNTLRPSLLHAHPSPPSGKSVCSSEVLAHRPALFGTSCGSTPSASLAIPPVEMITTALDVNWVFPSLPRSWYRASIQVVQTNRLRKEPIESSPRVTVQPRVEAVECTGWGPSKVHIPE